MGTGHTSSQNFGKRQILSWEIYLFLAAGSHFSFSVVYSLTEIENVRVFEYPRNTKKSSP